MISKDDVSFPVIPAKEFAERADNFKKLMARKSIDLVIAYSNLLDPAVVRYFTDVTPINESAAVLIPREGDLILCSGQACHEWSRYKSKVKDVRIMPEVGEIAGTEYEIEGQEDFENLFIEIKKKYPVKKIGVIGDLIFPNVIYQKLAKVFSEAKIISFEKDLNEFRMMKSENEIRCIAKAAEILSNAVEFSVNQLVPGDSELSLQANIEAEMLRLGAESYCHSWAPMIFSGSFNSNLCMLKSSRRPVQESEIVAVSAGALYEGYNAATAVPVVLGEIPANIKRDINVGRQAMEVVQQALKPGVSSRKVYNIYGDFLRDTGYRKNSPYGCVHSIGLIECEGPWISGFRDVILNENSTVAIDIYFKDLPWGSFRIEDTFAIHDKAEKLTSFNNKYLKRFD